MSADPDYPMCPGCRIADIEVSMAKDVRGDCPHCGTALFQPAMRCCLPDCDRLIPLTRAMPVCADCGVKIALRHMGEATMLDPAMAEQVRQSAASKEARRQGLTKTAVVYYVRLDAERIKIGFTSSLRARLSALRVRPADLIAWEPGGRELEHQRHQQFRGDRITANREDFRPSNGLLEWTTLLLKQHGLPDWARQPDTKTVMVRRA